MIFLLLIIVLILAIIFIKKTNFLKNSFISKKKIFIILGIIIIIAIIVGIVVTYIIEHRYDNDEVEENYFAVLQGGGGEILYNTYLYIEDGEYKYIQTELITESWGSSNWIETITKKGKLMFPQEVIEIAHENCSDGWVLLNKDIPENKFHKAYYKGDRITIDELYNLIAIK